ncbi:ABCG28 [Symbiodinium natans]|uniref:ABCG28 protein n=1 Tax=Symbiodinium natans TaxID=878477 RepID=A0A812RUQ4_9DINO|nr:ABCG28 [Symbiodinium natans]
MGPSGCGKSTLLDVLTGKKKTDSKWTVKGDILINNQKIDIEAIKPIIGFVPQDDVVHEGLTVRENIYYSAAKRMPAHTHGSRPASKLICGLKVKRALLCLSLLEASGHHQ